MNYRFTNKLIQLFAFWICISLANETQFWSFEKIVSTKTMRDFQISPDNKFVLFTVEQAMLQDGKDAYISKIYRSSSDGQRTNLLDHTCDISASQPKWSPNGRWISFLSEYSGIQNLFLIDTYHEGKAIPLTQAQCHIETYRWSPDSKYIVFMMPEKLENESSDLKTCYEYGKEKTINRLWLIDIENPLHLRPLTDDKYYVREAANFGETVPDYDWSPDGKTIVFAYSPGSGCAHYYHSSSLATIDIASGKITPWKKMEEHEILPIYSPNGNWVAYLSSPGKITLNRRIALRSSDGEQFKLLAPTDDEGIYYFGNSLLGWSQDEKHILFLEPKGTKLHLMFMPVDGTPGYAMTFGEHLVDLPTLSPDRKMLAFQMQNVKTPPEAYVTSLDSFNPIQISKVNQEIPDAQIPKTEVIRWFSKDGFQIEGLLTYPLHYQNGKHYPLLVDVHGGPMGYFNEHFIGLSYPYPYAALAEAGFFILRPNPRGSCGYGIDFREANIEDFGGGDYEDIMAGVASLIEQEVVDKEKLGIMGWSYGGYMVSWVIGQTRVFKAAAMGAGFSNVIHFSGTTDSQYFTKDYFKGSFLEKTSLYQERSPIFYAANVRTPCLMQHGALDLRVPLSQAYEYYHALKEVGQEVVLYIYPQMGHAPNTPQTCIDVMKTNFNWFTQYLP